MSKFEHRSSHRCLVLQDIERHDRSLRKHRKNSNYEDADFIDDDDENEDW